MEPSTDILSLYFHSYFENMKKITEIDHVPDEFLYQNFSESDFFDELGVIISENCLAIAFSVFPRLYPLCFSEISLLKSKETLTKSDQTRANIATKLILCLNGELNTAFSLRKRLLDTDFFENLAEETHFIELLCTKFKKSSISWAYKRYLFEKSCVCLKNEAIALNFERETEFLEKCLEKNPRNYYAWSHRLGLLKYLRNLQGNDESFVEILGKEREKLKKFCGKNIHDFSAFHYLQFVLKVQQTLGKLASFEEKAWVLELIAIYQQCYAENSGNSQENRLVSLRKHLDFLENIEKQQEF